MSRARTGTGDWCNRMLHSDEIRWPHTQYAVPTLGAPCDRTALQDAFAWDQVPALPADLVMRRFWSGVLTVMVSLSVFLRRDIRRSSSAPVI